MRLKQRWMSEKETLRRTIEMDVLEEKDMVLGNPQFGLWESFQKALQHILKASQKTSTIIIILTVVHSKKVWSIPL